MTTRQKHNRKWAVLSTLIGFFLTTLVWWLAGQDIFHPSRGEGLVMWFITGMTVSGTICIMNWKIFD